MARSVADELEHRNEHHCGWSDKRTVSSSVASPARVETLSSASRRAACSAASWEARACGRRHFLSANPSPCMVLYSAAGTRNSRSSALSPSSRSP